jgi:hypothetical protein
VSRGWLLVPVLLLVVLTAGTFERDAGSHTLRGHPAGTTLIHKVDHSRNAAQGCRRRLDGHGWPVEFLERNTSSLPLRRWVLKRWNRRAAWKCSVLRRQIEAENAWRASARGRWIAAAEYLSSISAGDPWPNCPDPHDGSGSWDDTKACEAPGYSWSACATSSMFVGPLQFHPMWRSLWQRFGIRC